MLWKAQEINPKKVQVDEGMVPDPKRTRELFDLANSPRGVHLLDPILVLAEERKYVLIAGVDRLQAAKEAGLIRIPALVGRDLARDEIASFRVAECQRQGPPPFRYVARELCILRDHLERTLEENGGIGIRPSHRVLANCSVGISHTEAGFRLRVSPIIERAVVDFLSGSQKRLALRDELELLPRSVFVRIKKGIPTDRFCDAAYERLLKRFLSAYGRDRRGTGFKRLSGRDSASSIEVASEFMLLKAAKEAARLGVPVPAPPTPCGPASRSRSWPPASEDQTPLEASSASDEPQTKDALDRSAALDVVGSMESPAFPESVGVPEASDAPGRNHDSETAAPPAGPDGPKAPKSEGTPVISETPVAAGTPDSTTTEEILDSLGATEASEIPEGPDNSRVPGNAETPDVLEALTTQETEDSPEAPQEREVSETGPVDSPSSTSAPDERETPRNALDAEASQLGDAAKNLDTSEASEAREISETSKVAVVSRAPEDPRITEISVDKLEPEPGNQVSGPEKPRGNRVSTPFEMIRHGVTVLLVGIRRVRTRVAVWLGASADDAPSEGGEGR